MAYMTLRTRSMKTVTTALGTHMFLAAWVYAFPQVGGQEAEGMKRNFDAELFPALEFYNK